MSIDPTTAVDNDNVVIDQVANEEVSSQEAETNQIQDAEIPEDNIVDEARELGWMPPEDFSGKAKNHMDPETFIKKRGDELSQLRRENHEILRKMDDLKNLQEERDKHVYNRALSDLKKEQIKAVEDGDMETFKRIDTEREELTQQNIPTRQPTQTIPPEVTDFSNRNPWYRQDQELRTEAEFINDQLSRKHPYMSLEQNLMETERKIKERYPEKFGINSNRPTKPYVETGRQSSVVARQEKRATYKDLPDDMSREAAKEFVKAGAFKNVDEYAEEYFKLRKVR